MAITNPIKSTSRTFDSILADANSDSELQNKPEWFKRYVAGVGDQLNTQLDLLNNESLLGTSVSRTAIADHLSLINYYLRSPTTSSGAVVFYLDRTLTGSQVFTADVLAAATVGTVNTPSLPFLSDSGYTHNIAGITFTVSGSTLTTAAAPTTGQVVRVASSGTLPTPLLIDTDYYTIKVTDTTFKLAETLADALSGNEITLTSAGTGVFTYTQYSFAVDLIQQTKVVDISLGNGDGSDFQEFELPDSDIIVTTITAEQGANIWTRVESFAETLSTDYEFMSILNSEGRVTIRFGGNGFGVVPGVGEITASYSTGGGVTSNVSTTDTVNVYTGGDSRILACANVEAMTGGSDEENAETAKIIAPLLLAASDRFVKASDGVALVLANFAVSQVVINSNYYGAGSCRVSVVPIGGGTPGAGLLSDIQDYLIDRSPLESFDVRTVAPSYTSINSSSTLAVKSGYTYATVETYFKLAWFLLFAETGAEIKQEYEADGIEDAVALINLYYGSTFDSSDYTQISTLLDNLEPAEFEKAFYDSDISGFIDTFVDGVDYFTFTAPVLPITLTGVEMTQSGAIAVTPA